MLLPLLFLLHLASATDSNSTTPCPEDAEPIDAPPGANETWCPDVVKDCSADIHFHRRVNETIQTVLLDINSTIKLAHDFMEEYEQRMHTFIVDLRVALLTDQQLLQRLLVLQETHGANWTNHCEFIRECRKYNFTHNPDEPCGEGEETTIDAESVTYLPVVSTESGEELNENRTTTSETERTTGYNETETTTIATTTTADPIEYEKLCRDVIKGKICKDCKRPTYNSTTAEFVCPQGFVFYGEERTLLCYYNGNVVEAQYVQKVERYEGKLECSVEKKKDTTTTSTTSTSTVTITTSTSIPPTTSYSDDQLISRCDQRRADVCHNCSNPLFNVTTMEYSCPHATSFYDNVGVLNCVIENDKAHAEDSNGTIYEGVLECRVYGNEPDKVQQKLCDATCDKDADCKIYAGQEIICSCQLGYADISQYHGKPGGTVCKKCHRMMDIDFVILYDQSGSISKANQLTFNIFLEELIDFVHSEAVDNRIAIVPFSDNATVQVPLTSDLKKIKKFLSDTRRSSMVAGSTNTAKAIDVANKEIFDTLPVNSTRRRVMIILTDGRPSICNREFQDPLSPGNTTDIDDCRKAELTTTSMTSTDKHKAVIFVVYVGQLEPHDKSFLEHLVDDDKLIHNEKFEDLRTHMMQNLQKKICEGE